MVLRLTGARDVRSIHETVADLVKSLGAYLSENDQKRLSVWSARDFSKFESAVEGALSEDLAMSLCALLIDFVLPLMEEGDEDGALVSCEAEECIKSLLGKILPSFSDVDRFITQYKSLHQEFLVEQQARDYADQIVAYRVGEEGEAILDGSAARLDAAKRLLQAAGAGRTQRAAALEARIGPLSSEVMAISQSVHASKAVSEGRIADSQRQFERTSAMAALSNQILSTEGGDSL
jgi:hypothetical protein